MDLNVIDKLSNEELEKLSRAIDEMEKTAREKVAAINYGRSFARQMIKAAAVMIPEVERASGVKSIKNGLEKSASENIDLLSVILPDPDEVGADFEKLASPEYYYNNCGRMLIRLFSSI